MYVDFELVLFGWVEELIDFVMVDFVDG